MINHAGNLEPYRGDLAPPESDNDLMQLRDAEQFVKFVWRNRWRFAAGIVACVLLGAIYYLSATPIYEATAQLLIEKKRSLAFDGVDARVVDHRDDPSAHIAVLKSPWFIKRVIDEHDFKNLASLSGQANPTKTIIGSLNVTHANGQDDVVADSIVLQLALRWPETEQAPVILNAVVETYKLLLDESRRTQNEDALKLVTQKAEQVEGELRELEGQHREYRQDSPLALHADDPTRLKEDPVLDLKERSSAVNVRRAEVQRRLAEVNTALASGADRSAALALVPDSFKRNAYDVMAARYSTLEESLLPLLIQEKTLLQTFGAGHRQVRDVREQIRLTRALLAPASKERKDLLTQVDPSYDVQWVDPVQSYILSLKHELGDLSASEVALAAQLEREQQTAKELANHQLEDERFVNEIARAESYYEGLTRQLQGIDLGKDSGGYETVILAAADQAVQVAPRLLLVIAGSGFFGIALGFGLALWSEAADQAFRGTSDVHRRLHVPVLGQVPLLASARSSRQITYATGHEPHQMLCTHYQPHSAESETYRAIRTALYFNNHGREQRVIQIASPNVGDGKSTLAANLAVSVAQSGKSVLLIDADLRCPRIDEMFGLSTDVGLSSLLYDEAELTDAIQPSGTPGLSLLSSGPIQHNAADLFSTPRFPELIAAVREMFDYVLIDTPALLAVTDAQVVAASVDGVLLTIRPSKSGRPNAERAVEILRMLDANLIGVVVNGTRIEVRDRYGDKYYMPSDANDQNGQRRERSAKDDNQADSGSASGNGSVVASGVGEPL